MSSLLSFWNTDMTYQELIYCKNMWDKPLPCNYQEKLSNIWTGKDCDLFPIRAMQDMADAGDFHNPEFSARKTLSDGNFQDLSPWIKSRLPKLDMPWILIVLINRN